MRYVGDDSVSSGHLNHAELVCANRDRGCPYEVSVSNAIHSAFKRLTPRECPNCGGDLRSAGER